jgi:S1-C subfamily serine protease
MRIPDWVVYLVVLVVVFTAIFVRGENEAPSFAPSSSIEPLERPAPVIAAGPRLPEPDPFDEKVLVQVGDVEDGVGTAFAINRSGAWLTARHVVDGCSRIGLVVGGGRVAEVDDVRISSDSDLALLYTDRAPRALPLALDRELRVGEWGYHVGFPHGAFAQASSQLLSRSQLVTRGRYDGEEPVLAWVETGRTATQGGSLAGMSGGPVFDDAGEVVGVTIAESTGRGRIYTAAPASIDRFLNENGFTPEPEEAMTAAMVSGELDADRLRRDLAVVKVVCQVNTL